MNTSQSLTKSFLSFKFYVKSKNVGFLTSPSASAVFEPIWTTLSLLTDVEVTEADPPPPDTDPPDLVSITLVAPPPPFVWTIVAPCDSTTLFFEVVVVVYSITSISVSSS